LVIYKGEAWLPTSAALALAGWKSRKTLYNYRNRIRSIKPNGYVERFWNKQDIHNLAKPKEQEQADPND